MVAGPDGAVLGDGHGDTVGVQRLPKAEPLALKVFLVTSPKGVVLTLDDLDWLREQAVRLGARSERS